MFHHPTTCSPYDDHPSDVDRFRLKEFVDFVAAGGADPRAQGEIMDAPKDVYGHTIKHYFGPTNQQRYNQFLEGLKHAFGDVATAAAIPLEQREIENESNSLFQTLLIHLTATSLETIRPTLNRYLGNIKLDVSIPTQEAEASPEPPTVLISRNTLNPLAHLKRAARGVVQSAVETTVGDARDVLNESLKNVRLDFSIQEPPLPIDHPLSRAQIGDSIQRSYNSFKTHACYLSHASLAAQSMQQQLQNLSDQVSEANLNTLVNGGEHHLNSFEDTLESIQEIVTTSSESDYSIREHQNHLVSTLHLDDSYVAEDELTLFLDQSAQKVASTLKNCAHAIDCIDKLIEVKESQHLRNLTRTTEEAFRQQKENLLVHFRSAFVKSTALIAIATRIVDHLKKQLRPYQEKEVPSGLMDQLADLVNQFCEKFSAFQNSAHALEQIRTSLLSESASICESASQAVGVAQSLLNINKKQRQKLNGQQSIEESEANSQTSLESIEESERRVRAMFPPQFLPLENSSVLIP